MDLSLIREFKYQVFRLPADTFGRIKSGSFARRLRKLSDCCESDLDADSCSRIHTVYVFRDLRILLYESGPKIRELSIAQTKFPTT